MTTPTDNWTQPTPPPPYGSAPYAPPTPYGAPQYAPPQYAPPQYAPAYVPPPVAPKKSHKARNISLFVLGALVVAGIVSAVAAKNSTNGQDYNNPTVLAADVQATYNTDIKDPSSPKYDPSGDVLVSMNCIKKSARVFECIGIFRAGDRDTAEVTVAADGQSWISS